MTPQMVPGFEYHAGMLVKDNSTGFVWRVPDDFGFPPSYYQTLQVNDAATGGILLAMLGRMVSVEAPWVPGNLWHVQIYHKGQTVRCGGASLGEACAKVAQEIGRWPNGESTTAA
jgi:hypothetical protein